MNKARRRRIHPIKTHLKPLIHSKTRTRTNNLMSLITKINSNLLKTNIARPWHRMKTIL